MQTDYTIDTQQVLRLIHEAEELAPQLPAEARPQLAALTNSALGVLTYYLRTRNPAVPEDHAMPIAELQAHIKSIKEPQYELASTISP